MQKFITCKGCGSQWYAHAERVPGSHKLTIPPSRLICRECGTVHMKTKHKPTQFELPQAEQIFSLLVESAVDGERIRQEMEVARSEEFLARRLAAQQQPELLPSH